MFRRLKSLWKGRWLSEDAYRAEVAKLVEQRPVPLFWLIGKTGSGKTSLVRYLTGAADAEIGTGFRPQTKDSRRYDFPSPEDPLLRFLDTRGLGEARYDPAEDLARFDAEADLIVVTVRLLDHALEEVVNALRSIREARPNRPVLLVLTCLHEAYPGEQHPEPDPVASGQWPEQSPTVVRRCWEEQKSRFEGLVDRIALVDFTRPDDGFHNPTLGGEGLSEALIDLLPAALRQTFVSWTDARHSLRDLQARRAAPYLVGYSLAAASAAAVPVPWIDLPVVFAIQAHMVTKLAELHQQPTTRELLQALGPLSGRVLLQYATRELLKAIPIVGQATNAALAFTYTYGMGKACLWYFAQAREGAAPSTDEIRRIWRDEISKAHTIWKQRHAAANESTP
ncbi:MAG: GTPase [Pirellulales bacterium]|jgi:uncharacterized protein (DUF697 family)/predicted GTPase